MQGYDRSLRTAWISRWSIFACLILLAAWTVHAQNLSGISGAVQDSSGATVPGAAVTVTNQETGLRRTIQTDERGRYRVPSLPVGRYEIRAEKEGFRTAVRTGLVLTVSQEAEVNLGLQIGE